MKEIELSFEVRVALNQCDVHSIEEGLLRLREEIFLGVLKRVMVEIEREAFRGAKLCKKCGGGLVKNGEERRKVKTLIGTVEVNRVRLRCQGCEEDIYPLDEALGLDAGERMTLGVRERSLWAAVEVSYEKVSEFLKRFTGLEVSRKKIHQMALEEGRRIEEWGRGEASRRKIFGES